MKTRPFSCNVDDCNRSFRDSFSLSEHLKEHEDCLAQDKKKFSCKKCSREFSAKQSLKEHIYTHFSKKTFKCPEPGCGKSFKQSCQLCNHKRVHKELNDMLVKKKEEDKKTEIILKDLTTKIVSSEPKEISKNLLSPIVKNEDIIMPRVDVIGFFKV